MKKKTPKQKLAERIEQSYLEESKCYQQTERLRREYKRRFGEEI